LGGVGVAGGTGERGRAPPGEKNKRKKSETGKKKRQKKPGNMGREVSGGGCGDFLPGPGVAHPRSGGDPPPPIFGGGGTGRGLLRFGGAGFFSACGESFLGRGELCGRWKKCLPPQFASLGWGRADGKEGVFRRGLDHQVPQKKRGGGGGAFWGEGGNPPGPRAGEKGGNAGGLDWGGFFLGGVFLFFWALFGGISPFSFGKRGGFGFALPVGALSFSNLLGGRPPPSDFCKAPPKGHSGVGAQGGSLGRIGARPRGGSR